MRQRAVIVLQEVHGSEKLLRARVDSQPCPHTLLFSQFVDESADDARAGTGGAAALIPWLTHAQLEQMHPSQLPIFAHEELVKGRVQIVAVTN
eukprot:412178-Pyramimonas_sp.AAC.1